MSGFLTIGDYRKHIEKLMEELIGPSQPDDAELFREYFAQLGSHLDPAKFAAFMKARIRPQLKARALAVTFAPDVEHQVFRVEGMFGHPSDTLFGLWWVKFDSLTPALQRFVMEIVCLNREQLLHIEVPDLPQALLIYNHATLKALALLDPEDDLAERLMRPYGLLDSEPTWRPDNFWQRDVLQGWLHAPIPEIWKQRAVKAMHNVMLREYADEQEHMRHNFRLKQYVLAINSHINYWPYSDDLFASQAEFLLSLHKVDLEELWESNMRSLFDPLHDHKWHDLRHRLARKLVIKRNWWANPKPFNVSENIELVETWLKTFPEDKELTAALQQPLMEALRIRDESISNQRRLEEHAADVVRRLFEPESK